MSETPKERYARIIESVARSRRDDAPIQSADNGAQVDAESTIGANPYRLEGDNLVGDSIRQLAQGLTLGGADEAKASTTFALRIKHLKKPIPAPRSDFRLVADWLLVSSAEAER